MSQVDQILQGGRVAMLSGGAAWMAAIRGEGAGGLGTGVGGGEGSLAHQAAAHLEELLSRRRRRVLALMEWIRQQRMKMQLRMADKKVGRADQDALSPC
jgi:hypothetical protein